MDHHLEAHRSTAELPGGLRLSCMVSDLDHMQGSFKQSKWALFTDQVPVLEPNCPSAPPVSQCIAVALADFTSITAPFIIAKTSLGHVPDL